MPDSGERATRGFRWNFERLAPRHASDRVLIRAIHSVFLDGFQLDQGWSEDKIEHQLRTSSILGLLRSDEVGDLGLYGYAFYSVPCQTCLERHLLWEDAICVTKDPDVRGHGYSDRALADAFACYPTHQFGWLGGRTQNPVVFLRYRRRGGLFPFDESYESCDGQTLMRFLVEHIDEVGRKRVNLDARHGICRGVYAEGVLGHYSLDIQGTEVFEAHLRKIGFDRSGGDALVAVARIEPGLESGR